MIHVWCDAIRRGVCGECGCHHTHTHWVLAIVATTPLSLPPRNLKQPAQFAFKEEDQDHLRTYSNLLVDHCCAHDYLERVLLDMAETTQRLLLESSISTDKARTELKQTLKKYKAILYNTIHLQELERLALVAQHPNATSNLIRGSGR